MEGFMVTGNKEFNSLEQFSPFLNLFDRLLQELFILGMLDPVILIWNYFLTILTLDKPVLINNWYSLSHTI
jgi:hypothetical protein